MNNGTAIGADIGGSHITVSAVDRYTKKLIMESWIRKTVDSTAGAEEIFDLWANALSESIAVSNSTIECIGIAMPGPMDYKNGICLIRDQQKFQSLYGMNIGKQLARRLNFAPEKILFMNDAACYLKGELYSGSVKDFSSAIGVTLGTGLGTSHTSGGEAMDSALWNMSFQDGISEDYLSTRWFVKRFEEIGGQKIRDVKDLIERYKASPHFKTVFAEFSLNLARFLYLFIEIKKPQAAVIGGNIANADAYFLEETNRQLFRMLGYSFPVRRSALGESAALIGAASLGNINEGVKLW